MRHEDGTLARKCSIRIDVMRHPDASSPPPFRARVGRDKANALHPVSPFFVVITTRRRVTVLCLQGVDGLVNENRENVRRRKHVKCFGIEGNLID